MSKSLEEKIKNEACIGNIRGMESKKSMDYADASPISSFINQDSILSSRPKIHHINTHKDDDSYNLKHGRKMLLIFNNRKFSNDYHEERNGVNKDTKAIIDTFYPLGFNINEHENLTVAEIKENISSFSNMDDLSCLIIFISTHGSENDVLYAFDKSYHLRRDIMDRLSPDKFPSLVGKPKVIFVQACQGLKKEKGTPVKFEMKNNTDEVDGGAIYTMSQNTDILLATSCYPGYFSYRSPKSGSWFIQTLCSEITKSSPKEDLLSIMTTVGRKVSLNYTSSSKDPVTDQGKQTPMIESTLIRKIYLKSCEP